MASRSVLACAVFLTLICSVVAGRRGLDAFLKLPSDSTTAFPGTKWALLIAGSAGYGNYRHQADICHAYQLLRKNGLRAENIVVFMADDIAHNVDNPYPGTIVNKPGGEDVYAGVPKDYTGGNVSVHNFLAALRGNASAIRGGSGKVLASGPDDHVFVYYSDHGGPGILGMPTLPFLFADDIVNTLKAKHAANGYKELVFYLEACESGSIFEGLLPPDIHVYATTASNAMESSWGTYCPGMRPAPPPEFETCLGDLYSVAWMEDSDMHNLEKETLHDQYLIVKDRTSNHATYDSGSHVMQYGDLAIHAQLASHYLGTDPANSEAPPATVPDFGDEPESVLSAGQRLFNLGEAAQAVSQRDADLLHMWHKYQRAAEGSARKSQALEEFTRVTAERSHIDRSVALIDKLLLGQRNGVLVGRPEGAPLVDDWDCLRDMVRVFESKCGSLTQYGMKHTRTFAHLCNAGVSSESLATAAGDACMGTTRQVASAGVFSA